MSDIINLINELGDSSWLKRKQASEKLRNIAVEDSSVYSELENILETTENEDIIFWAIRTIAGIEGDAPLNTLRNMGNKNSTVRSYVALALGESSYDITIDLLIEYSGDNSWSVCNNAMLSLVNMGEKALPAIVDSLKKANYNKAFWLTKTLSRMGEKGVTVLEHFLKFNNRDVSVLVAEALGESTERKAIEVLLRCLEDESYTVRQNAIDALIKIGPDILEPMLDFLNTTVKNIKNDVDYIINHLDARKINVLAELLNSDNRTLKMSAAEYLGKTGSQFAIKPLIEMLKDKLWLVRKSAAKGLVLIGEKAISELMSCMETSDENTKYWIANVLGKIGEPALPELVRILREGSKDLRMYAVMALGEFRNEKAIFPLINAFSDEAWPVRNSAASALINFGNLALVPVLKSLLSQNDDIRFWSRKVFEEIAPREIDRLIDLVTYDLDGELRYMVAYGLGIVADHKAIPALINALLNDSNDWVRKYAATALGKIKEEKCVEPLIRVLADDNEEIAYWVARVLGQMGETAVDKLRECLDHPEEKVRFFAIIALGSIGDEKSIHILIKILGEEGEGSQRAVKALSETDKSIPLLIEALGSSNLNIRSNASKALVKIGEKAVEPLMNVVDSDNKEIHYWAAKSLREIQTGSQK